MNFFHLKKKIKFRKYQTVAEFHGKIWKKRQKLKQPKASKGFCSWIDSTMFKPVFILYEKLYINTPLRNKQLRSVKAGPHLDQTWDTFFFNFMAKHNRYLLLRSWLLLRMRQLLDTGGRSISSKAAGFRLWEPRLDGKNLGGKKRFGKNRGGKDLVGNDLGGKGSEEKIPRYKKPAGKRPRGERPVEKDRGESTSHAHRDLHAQGSDFFQSIHYSNMHNCKACTKYSFPSLLLKNFFVEKSQA